MLRKLLLRTKLPPAYGLLPSPLPTIEVGTLDLVALGFVALQVEFLHADPHALGEVAAGETAEFFYGGLSEGGLEGDYEGVQLGLLGGGGGGAGGWGLGGFAGRDLGQGFEGGIP